MTFATEAQLTSIDKAHDSLVAVGKGTVKQAGELLSHIFLAQAILTNTGVDKAVKTVEKLGFKIPALNQTLANKLQACDQPSVSSASDGTPKEAQSVVSDKKIQKRRRNHFSSPARMCRS